MNGFEIAFGIGFAFLLGWLSWGFERLLKRIANAQERQAAALEDIADSLAATFYDNEEDGTLSDSTRLVIALEKLASIEPPAAPKPDNVTAKE